MLTFLEISYVKTSITEFLCVFKLADVMPVHKKEIKSNKVNYRPISILPNLSKIYEKLMYQELYEHFNSIFTKTMWVSKRL